MEKTTTSTVVEKNLGDFHPVRLNDDSEVDALHETTFSSRVGNGFQLILNIMLEMFTPHEKIDDVMNQQIEQGGMGLKVFNAVQKLRDTQKNIEKMIVVRNGEIDEIQVKILAELRKIPIKSKDGPIAGAQRKKAAILLKKKKLLERMIESQESQLMNLHSQELRLRQSIIDVEVIESYSAFKDTLQIQNKVLNINQISDLQELIPKLMDESEEISQKLSENITNTQFDDNELENELLQMEVEIQLDLMEDTTPSQPIVSPPKPQTTNQELMKDQKIIIKATPQIINSRQEDTDELEELRKELQDTKISPNTKPSAKIAIK